MGPDPGDLLGLLFEHSPIPHFVSDRAGRIVMANPAYAALLGTTRDAAVGTRPVDVTHPDDVGALVDQGGRLVRGEVDLIEVELRVIRANGELRWCVATCTLAEREGQEPLIISHLRDITERRRAEDELARTLSRFQVLADSLPIGVYQRDHNGDLTYVNRRWVEITGISEADALGHDHLAMVHPDDRDQLLAASLRLAVEGGDYHQQYRIVRPDGDIRWVSTRALWLPFTDHEDEDRAYVGSLEDVTHLLEALETSSKLTAQLAHEATHDPLTGLPNRVLLLDHLDQALDPEKGDPDPVALLFIDLDRLKIVNDRLGHDVGDDLLDAVATRLAAVTRPGDMVARLGGDEFVVLCRGVHDEADAGSLAQRVLDAVSGEPVRLRGTEVSLTASVGIAMSSADRADHAEALLRDADAAMYRAKEQGRARYELFDDHMRERATDRQRVVDELREAIGTGQLVLDFQPIVDLGSGTVTAVEALVRWHHPERGVLRPPGFIDIAEQSGLIVEIGAEVLELACQQLVEWQAELGERCPRIHINLSPRQIATPGLVEGFMEVVGRTGADASRLCLEITEGAFATDHSAAAVILTALRAVGATIAIDDFGSGHSSLAHLHRFPVDVLKVDRSFVERLGPDSSDSAITAAVIRLAHTLGLQAIAEGVETPDQLAQLVSLGCDAVQGYLLAAPGPAEEVVGSITGASLLAAGLSASG